MTEKFQLILTFISVLFGVVAATYFYQSTDVFVNVLRKPLRLISSGMFTIALGVLLGAFISYEAHQGLAFFLLNVPLEAYFYMLYLIGSVMIILGARQFAFRPNISK